MRRLNRHWVAAVGLAAGFGLLAPGTALGHDDHRHRDRDRDHARHRVEHRHHHHRVEREQRRAERQRDREHRRAERQHDREHRRAERQHDREHRRAERQHRREHRHAPRALLHRRVQHHYHSPYWGYHRVRIEHHGAFHCAPCKRSFRRHREFRRHLHHAHHVPLHRIWHHLVHATFGWIYYG